MTDKYIETGNDEIKCEQNYDGSVNREKHAHVHFSLGHEDSAILQKNRELDEEKCWSIDDIRDMYPLRYL